MSNDPVSITELDLYNELQRTDKRYDSKQDQAAAMMKRFKEIEAARKPAEETAPNPFLLGIP